MRTPNGTDRQAAKLTVLLVDDCHPFREGMRQIVDASGQIAGVGEAADGGETIRLAPELGLDVILMDINMPGVDGIRATETMARLCPQSIVIILMMVQDDDYAIQAVRAGAKGYPLKRPAPAR